MGTRRVRAFALLVTVLLMGGCGRAAMNDDQATRVAVDAFAAAGFDADVGEIVEDATVDRAIDGEFIQVHQVEMLVGDRSYLAGVDRKQGAVVRLTEPNDTTLTDAEVLAIAEYRDNPAEDAARRSRTVVWVIVVILGIVGTVVYFRRERRKAELAVNDAQEIPLN